jgi:hypothetical protein
LTRKAGSAASVGIRAATGMTAAIEMIAAVMRIPTKPHTIPSGALEPDIGVRHRTFRTLLVAHRE